MADQKLPDPNPTSSSRYKERVFAVRKTRLSRRLVILGFLLASSLHLIFAFQNCGMSYTTDASSFEVPLPVEDAPAPGYDPGAPPSEKKILTDLPDLSQPDTPLDISSRLAVANSTTCLAPKDRLYCIGENGSQQGANTLNGTLLKSAQDANLFNDATILNTDQTIKRLSAGANHFCAVMNTGKIVCWGMNDKKQLGHTDSNSRAPAILGTANAPNDFSPQGITSGLTMNFVISSGKVYCWGDCTGFTPSSPALSPSLISATFPDSVVSVAASSDAQNKKICVVLANSKAMCLLPNGQPEYVTNPSSPSEPVLGVRQVVMGPKHECFLIHDAVLCRGDNQLGQLGDGSGRSSSDGLVLTYDLGKGQGVKQLASAGNTTCALNDQELIYCWGSNFKGALGAGETCPASNETCFQNSPQIVMHSDKFKSQQLNIREISGGAIPISDQATAGRFCITFDDGSTSCWGQRYLGDDRDTYGENGDTFSARLKNVLFAQAAAPNDPTPPTSDEQFATRGGPSDAPISAPQDAERLPESQDIAIPVEMDRRLARTQRMTCGWPDTNMYCWGDNGGSSPGYLNGSQSYYNKVTKVPTNADLLNNSEHLNSGQTFKAVFQSTIGAICSLMTTGKVRCWNSSKIWYQEPFGPEVSKVKPDQIAVLSDSLWLVLVNGGIKSWNSGSTTAPTWVTGFSDSETIKVHSIAASPGATKACALLRDGTAKCFSTGSGTTSKVKNPKDTSTSLAGIRQVAVGYQHQCFLVGDAVACMGKNDKGQLGNDTTMDSAADTPVVVRTLAAGAGVKLIAAAGNTTCAVKIDQSVHCWGSNQDGALGIGLSPDCAGNNSAAISCYSKLPRLVTSTNKIPSTLTIEEIQVLGDNTQSSMTANARQVCIRLSNKGVSCWGGMYLGNETSDSTNKPTPVKFEAANQPTDPNAGVPDTSNQSFQQGNGISDSSLGSGTQAATVPRNPGNPTPTPLPIQSRISIVNNSVCAFPDKKMYCWGENTIGNGYVLGSETYKKISQTNAIDSDILNSSEHLKDSQYFTQLAGHPTNSRRCVLMSNGKIRCWDLNNVFYANSYWTNSYNVKQIERAEFYLWLVADGALMKWNQPSDSTVISNPTIPYSSLSSNVEAVSGIWDEQPCVILKGSTAKCQGKTILDPEDRSKALTGVKQIVRGGGGPGTGNYCMLVHDGVLCGGDNTNGELGDGTSMNSSSFEVPVIPKGLSSGVKLIAGGGAYNYATYCAVKTDNRVYCWGSNHSGALGIGIEYNDCIRKSADDPQQKELACRSLEPRLVSSTNNIASSGKNIVEIAVSRDGTGSAPYRSVCILLSDKSMSCWGKSYLGNGSSAGSTTPVPVQFPAQ